MPPKFEGFVPPQEHDEKLEQEAEAQVGKAESQELTPEQVAGDLTSSYWTKRLQETQGSMKNPDIRVQGGDFDMARSEAYLKNIRDGKFFESVDVSGTYDGEPTQTTESSAYDFFKRIADSTERRIELFKDSPELVEKYKREGEQAQKIVDAIEKTRPVEAELTPEQVAKNEVTSYFSDRLVKNQEAMSNPDITVQGGDFDVARCEAYIKQAKEGKFFDEVAFSGTYDGQPTATAESSPYDFFKRIADNTERYIELFKDNPELVEKGKKQGEEARKIAEAMEKFKPAEKEPTPEEMAKNEVVTYFLTRLQETGASMRNPDVKVQGGDFDIARCQAFIKQAKEGKFLEAFNISGTYDGEPTELKSSSIFDFFKGIAEGTERYAEVFKDNPDLVEKRKQQGKEAQKIVDTILNIIKNKV